MLKLLLKLWWKQQRRNFHKRDAVVGAYILFIYVVIGVTFFFSFTENGGSFADEDLPSTLGFILVVSMLLPDIFLKLVMKKDMTAMDDYIKSRPVPERIWNRFLLATNLVSFWNYVLPVMMIPVFIFLLSIPQAIGCFLLLYAFSYVDGIYITCFRKATEWMLKWPLILGWIGMFGLLIGYIVVSAFFPIWMAYIGMIIFAGAVLAGLIAYLCNLKIYNEQKHKVSRFRGFSHVNLLSLLYIGTMRAKRVRNMVLVIAIIFLFDAYMYAFLPASPGMAESVSLYVAGAVLLPSVCLSQWTFGIEANFFHGLMTKPVKVEQLLQNCFYFYVLLTAVVLIFVLPFLFLNVGVTIFTLLGAFCMTIFLSLFNLPTCLFSSRLEIFGNSMFNMQGANVKINLYGIVFLLPVAALVVEYIYLGEVAWCITSVALAVLSVAIHKWAIAKLAAVYNKKKYDRMEKYMEN